MLRVKTITGTGQKIPVVVTDKTRLYVTQTDEGVLITAEDNAGKTTGFIKDGSAGGIESATTSEWNSTPGLVSEKNHIYVYTDHQTKTDEEGNIINIPGIKVGDGLAYLIDLPFTDTLYAEHILNKTIHIDQQERETWNNKVSVMTRGEELILITD